MSMLDAIRVAEENAEAKRRLANEQVVLLLEKTKQDAEIKSQKMLLDANEIELFLSNKNLEEIAEKEREIDTANAKRDEFIAKKAREKGAKAAEFILGKVIKQ